MIESLIQLLLALAVTGGASQYSPGMMQVTIVNRQSHLAHPYLPDPLPVVDGYVATADCNDIGSILWIRPVGVTRWEMFLVVDCAGPQLRADGMTGGQWMVANNILVEVDYLTAVRWDTVGSGIQVEALTN